jgi:uncharacterized protein
MTKIKTSKPMKYLWLLLVLWANPIILAQSIESSQNSLGFENPNYNERLANQLGSDDYGMKSYYFVLLKTGHNESLDQELIKESFKGHLQNINRLVAEGRLVLAGPLGMNEREYRGIFVFNNLNSLEEVVELLQRDPAITNRFLDYEIYSWYGSAALPEYLPYADQIWKLKP